MTTKTTLGLSVVVVVVYYVYFFFSSRRRHTRCSRDWSSDVCSSDLPDPSAPQSMRFDLTDLQLFVHILDCGTLTAAAGRAHMTLASASERVRSEERRVGEEGRSRWSPYH